MDLSSLPPILHECPGLTIASKREVEINDVSFMFPNSKKLKLAIVG